MRLPSEANINKARVFALRESSKLRQALRTEGTEERDAFIKQLDAKTPQEFAVAIILMRLSEYNVKARQDLNIKFPTEPESTAPLEEQEAYQKEIDNFPETFSKVLIQKMDELKNKDMADLVQLPVENLQRFYEEELINFLCKSTLDKAFLDYCIATNTFYDEEMTRPGFKSVEDFNESSPLLQQQLRETYSNLELGMEEIKK
jgi:hypothetical protein